MGCPDTNDYPEWRNRDWTEGGGGFGLGGFPGGPLRFPWGGFGNGDLINFPPPPLFQNIWEDLLGMPHLPTMADIGCAPMCDATPATGTISRNRDYFLSPDWMCLKDSLSVAFKDFTSIDLIDSAVDWAVGDDSRLKPNGRTAVEAANLAVEYVETHEHTQDYLRKGWRAITESRMSRKYVKKTAGKFSKVFLVAGGLVSANEGRKSFKECMAQ